jgi:hypothetical protein
MIRLMRIRIINTAVNFQKVRVLKEPDPLKYRCFLKSKKEIATVADTEAKKWAQVIGMDMKKSKLEIETNIPGSSIIWRANISSWLL